LSKRKYQDVVWQFYRQKPDFSPKSINQNHERFYKKG